MGLLDKLTQQGSILTNLDGATPQPFNTQVTHLDPQSLVGSNLDLEGETPIGYNGGLNNSNILNNGLVGSNLDISNGLTPTQYLNNLPE